MDTQKQIENLKENKDYLYHLIEQWLALRDDEEDENRKYKRWLLPIILSIILATLFIVIFATSEKIMWFGIGVMGMIDLLLLGLIGLFIWFILETKKSIQTCNKEIDHCYKTIEKINILIKDLERSKADEERSFSKPRRLKSLY